MTFCNFCCSSSQSDAAAAAAAADDDDDDNEQFACARSRRKASDEHTYSTSQTISASYRNCTYSDALSVLLLGLAIPAIRCGFQANPTPRLNPGYDKTLCDNPCETPLKQNIATKTPDIRTFWHKILITTNPYDKISSSVQYFSVQSPHILATSRRNVSVTQVERVSCRGNRGKFVLARGGVAALTPSVDGISTRPYRCFIAYLAANNDG